MSKVISHENHLKITHDPMDIHGIGYKQQTFLTPEYDGERGGVLLEIVFGHTAFGRFLTVEDVQATVEWLENWLKKQIAEATK